MSDQDKIISLCDRFKDQQDGWINMTFKWAMPIGDGFVALYGEFEDLQLSFFIDANAIDEDLIKNFDLKKDEKIIFKTNFDLISHSFMGMMSGDVYAIVTKLEKKLPIPTTIHRIKPDVS